MTTTQHPIVAQPWQLKPNLGAVLVPLVPEPVKHPATWSWSGAKGQHIDWLHGKKPDDIRLLKALKWQVGDRIYLQEPWCDVVRDGVTLDYFVEKDAPLWNVWYPAKNMPPEAAQFWHEITSVEVTQAKALDMPTLIASKLTCWGDPSEDLRLLESEVANNWNKYNPEHPWRGDRFVVILRIRACSLELRY